MPLFEIWPCFTLPTAFYAPPSHATMQRRQMAMQEQVPFSGPPAYHKSEHPKMKNEGCRASLDSSYFDG